MSDEEVARSLGIRWRPEEFSTDVGALLERLEFEMRRVGDPALPPLRPGASEDEIRSRLEPTGLDVHPDLLTWFGWTTGPGADLPGYGMGLGSTTPIQLEAVTSFWLKQESRYVSDAVAFPEYEAGRWMPFLENSGFDCGFDEFRGSIPLVSTWEEQFWRVPSLATLLWWWIGLRVDGPRGGSMDATEFSSLFGEVRVCRSMALRLEIGEQ